MLQGFSWIANENGGACGKLLILIEKDAQRDERAGHLQWSRAANLIICEGVIQ